MLLSQANVNGNLLTTLFIVYFSDTHLWARFRLFNYFTPVLDFNNQGIYRTHLKRIIDVDGPSIVNRN